MTSFSRFTVGHNHLATLVVKTIHSDCHVMTLTG